MVRLSTLKNSAQVMTRTFWFAPEGKPDARFKVRVHYMSPALFAEEQEKVKVRSTNQRRRAELDPAELRKTIASEVLIQAIERVEGCTVGKLRSLVPMDAAAVAAAGGVDAVVPMDPTVAGQRDLARDNLIFLLCESNEFFEWLLDVCTDLGQFQDKEWEDQVKNSVHGPDTSSASA